MPKKKFVKKSTKKVVKNTSLKEGESCCASSWAWWAVGILALLVVLFLVYRGISGNAISESGSSGSLVTIISNVVDGFVQISNKVLVPILGETDNGEIFFGKLLALIIVCSFSYVILKKSLSVFFSEHNGILWILTIAVGLLGTRFLTNEMIYMIVIPNSAFVIAVASAVPLILAFFIIEGLGAGAKTLKKILWALFGCVFLGIYIVRLDTLGNLAWIYLAVAIIALIMIMFGSKASDKAKEILTEEKAAGSAKIKSLKKKFDQLHEEEVHYRNARDILTVGTPEWAEQDNKHKEIVKKMTKLLAEIKVLGG